MEMPTVSPSQSDSKSAQRSTLMPTAAAIEGSVTNNKSRERVK
jgi:hypothetical protein